MIARLVTPRGHTEYLALHLGPVRAREVWVPVRQACEASELEALKVCVRDVQAQMEPLPGETKRLYGLCDIRGREPSDREQERMQALSWSVSGAFVRTWRNMARLVDEPTIWDEVNINARLMAGRILARVRPSAEDTARRVPLLISTVAKRHGCDLERAKERPEALEQVLADVAVELDIAGMAPDEISVWIDRSRRNLMEDSTPASTPAGDSEGEEP